MLVPSTQTQQWTTSGGWWTYQYRPPGPSSGKPQGAGGHTSTSHPDLVVDNHRGLLDIPVPSTRTQKWTTLGGWWIYQYRPTGPSRGQPQGAGGYTSTVHLDLVVDNLRGLLDLQVQYRSQVVGCALHVPHRVVFLKLRAQLGRPFSPRSYTLTFDNQLQTTIHARRPIHIQRYCNASTNQRQEFTKDTVISPDSLMHYAIDCQRGLL